MKSTVPTFLYTLSFENNIFLIALQLKKNSKVNKPLIGLIGWSVVSRAVTALLMWDLTGNFYVNFYFNF